MQMSRLSSIPPANDSRRAGNSEPPRAILQSPARRRAMQPSKTTMAQLVLLADQNDDLGVGALVMDLHGSVRFVNSIASDLLGIPQDPDGGLMFMQCIDSMSRKSRILRELRDLGLAFQVPTKIHPDLGSSSSDWLVTVKKHLDAEGNPLAYTMTLTENAETAALAGVDALTCLPNRRTFTADFTREFNAVKRHLMPLSLLYLDVDRFKRFNDEHGHDVGDAVLKTVALCLAQTVRTTDLACRLGGEEFAVILPRTDENGAKVLAEKLREAVEHCTVEFLGSQYSVTISVGVATYHVEDNASVDSLIRDADHAMLRAKEDGRNRVKVASATKAA